MVFRGRPSRACQQCRERRLRVRKRICNNTQERLYSLANTTQCDFQRPSCSSCNRVSAPCVGYRDTHTIRIADETDDVRTKAIAGGSAANSPQITYLAPNTETAGRKMFFANYVCNFSQTWDVLLKYTNSVGVPEHLALSLDAVSLAFMAHNTGSSQAKDLSRKSTSLHCVLSTWNCRTRNPRRKRQHSRAHYSSTSSRR